MLLSYKVNAFKVKKLSNCFARNIPKQDERIFLIF